MMFPISTRHKRDSDSSKLELIGKVQALYDFEGNSYENLDLMCLKRLLQIFLSFASGAVILHSNNTFFKCWCCQKSELLKLHLVLEYSSDLLEWHSCAHFIGIAW